MAKPLDRGFALAYALLLSVVFLTLFAALALGYRDTMRANRFSEDTVRARCLADLGNELVYQLFTEKGLKFINGAALPFTFTNDPETSNPADYFRGIPAANKAALASQMGKEQLGGTFTVTVMDAESQGLSLPNGGTYWTLNCTAKVNSRESSTEESSRFLVKVGVPFVNFLRIGRGPLMVGGGAQWEGPMFAVDGDDGVLASVDVTASITRENMLSGEAVTQGLFSQMQGVIKSQGPVQMVNKNTMLSPALTTVMGLPIPKTSLSGGDTLDSNPLGGGIEATGPLTMEPFTTLSFRQDGIDEVLESVKALATADPGKIETLDITTGAFAGGGVGVLVEIDGTTVRFYQAEREKVGEVYDLACWLSIFETKAAGIVDHDKNRLESLHGNGASAVEAGYKEVAWNDPAYEEKPYPPELLAKAEDFVADRHLSLTLPSPGDTGDYFPVYTVKPAGAALKTVTLNPSKWTALRVVASELTCQGRNGTGVPVQLPPPLFVRGKADGRLFLAYDLAEPAATAMKALEEQKVVPNQIYILSEDGATVAGGLGLTDEAGVITESDSSEEGGDDMVMLMALGDVRSWGVPAFFLDTLYQDLPTPAIRNLLNESLADPGVLAEDLTESSPSKKCKVFAVSASGREHVRTNGLTVELQRSVPGGGRMLTGVYEPDGSYPHFLWSSLDPGSTLGLVGTAILPRRMRLCYRENNQRYSWTGARCGLNSDTTSWLTSGEFRYDYRWREIPARILGQSLGLPVGPILIDRRGL